MMKRILILLTSLLTMSAQAQTHDWENPAVLGTRHAATALEMEGV